MSNGTVEIYDLMACNVYMDFVTDLPKEQHKFLVAFRPTGGAPVYELIESLTAKGPDGYEVEIANQPYTIENLNGWIVDNTTNSHWYMINLYTGFMAPGEYVIEVKCKDGSVKTISRVQENGATERMMPAYLDYREQLEKSYTPGNHHPFKEGTSLENVAIDCDSFKELSGVDAYYVFRICEAENQKQFNPHNLYWWDNIFLSRMVDPDAGKNKNHLVLGKPLEAGKAYTYFCELTDGNTMGGTNLCIFQPYQTFRT